MSAPTPKFSSVTSELLDWVDDQITASGIDDEVGLLILAAMEGQAALDAYLDEGTSSKRDRERGPETKSSASGTFLASIEVEGFRGVGPTTTLQLKPRPGLTIVAGRNGSGKSSLAEALELALTGNTYRWLNKSLMWREQWRNLHHDQARIRIGIVEEASGPISIATTWPAGVTDLEGRTTHTQRRVGGQVQAQQTGLGDLGWARPLEQFRPMLSYDELGGLLEQGSSKLYDALASILGVEQLSDALQRIQVRAKERKLPQAAASSRRKTLQAQVAQLDDERAKAAAALLRKTAPDTAALRALATGSTDVAAGPIGALKVLTSLEYPATIEQVTEVASRLRKGVAAVADSAETLSQREMARLELLEGALVVHADHGDMTCPVCRQGSLDESWAQTSRDLAQRARRQLSDYDLAQQTLALARTDLRKLLAPRPGALQSAPIPGADTAVGAARQAWEGFVDVPKGEDSATILAVADHIETRVGPLLAALSELHTTAAAAIDRLNDAWQPLASQIAAWCDEYDAAAADRPLVERLTAAEKWLKDNDLALKNDRLRPIADGARHAWSKLRQESNVDIGTLALEGSANKRRVRVDATIDGADAGSIAVLSQGELHALALSLFIPRATMAASPFRFLILDDPVQAMDPAKVDGLVDLLGELAQDRQVIVLSHDDRLPAAVRRSSIDATILEVSRGKDSHVTISTLTDPADRYLGDAFGLVKEWEEGRVEEFALRRTLPGLLRFAVEAAAKDRYYSRAIGGGASLREVEKQWQDAATTRQKVTLAVFAESRDNHELEWWATAPHRKFGLRNVGTAMHSGLKETIDPRDAARDVEKLIIDLRNAG